MQRQYGLYFASWKRSCNLIQVDIISSYQLKIVFFLRVAQLTVRRIFWWPSSTALLSKMKSEIIFDYLFILSPFILLLSILHLFIGSNWA